MALTTPLPPHSFKPLLADLLQRRTESLVLLGAGAVHVGLTLAGLPGWACPFKAALGIPCPGCGLGTATAALLRGNWQEALSVHAFAPVFLLAILLLAVGVLLPATMRPVFIQRVAVFEQRTALAYWLFLGLFLYWGLRLLLPGLALPTGWLQPFV
jgi:hypothetical protein